MFEQAPGVGDAQGSLACFSPWGHKELDTTERLNGDEKGDLALPLAPVKSCVATRYLRGNV